MGCAFVVAFQSRELCALQDAVCPSFLYFVSLDLFGDFRMRADGNKGSV